MSKQGIKPKVCLACDDLMRTGQAAPATCVKDDPPPEKSSILQIVSEYERAEHKVEIERFIDGLLIQGVRYTQEPFSDLLQIKG